MASACDRPPPTAAYVHVPFCVHRCGYCNFTLVAGRDDLVSPYLQAIERELQRLDRPYPVKTLFFGGGTPTRLTPEQLAQLFQIVLAWHPLAADGEFSIEANPADLCEEKLAVCRQFGVNRVSLGVQSFDDRKLAFLERDHRAEQIASAYKLVRASVRSVALDLMFGVPEESETIWQRDLEQALALEPDHLSTYGLTLERGTRFWSRWQHGQFAALDEEIQRRMYLAAHDCLSAAGFNHYEVSNFARPGHRCRHNETYWLANEYFAVGPGAARYVNGRRETNHRSPFTYLKRVLNDESPVAEVEILSPESAARERLVLGLRRLEGVRRSSFAAQSGFEMDELVGPALQRFVELGLLIDKQDLIRLTRKGLLVSDAMWADFL